MLVACLCVCGCWDEWCVRVGVWCVSVDLLWMMWDDVAMRVRGAVWVEASVLLCFVCECGLTVDDVG